jgi:hypothetical protein
MSLSPGFEPIEHVGIDPHRRLFLDRPEELIAPHRVRPPIGRQSRVIGVVVERPVALFVKPPRFVADFDPLRKSTGVRGPLILFRLSG